MKKIIFIVVYIVVQVAVALTAEIQKINLGAIIFPANILLCIFMVWMFWPLFQEKFQNLKENKKRYLKYMAIGYIIMLGGSILLTLLMGTVKAENQELLQGAIDGVHPMIFALAVGIFFPLIEEFIFREILIGSLSKKISSYIAVPLSIAAFLFMHSGLDIRQVIPYLPMTLAFTGVYLISDRNFLVSGLLHILNNSIAVIFMLSMR